MFSAHEIFDLGIRIEENGERFYRRALENSSDPSLRELLRWLADEEADHGDRFLQMKASLGEVNDHLWMEQVSGALLQSSVKDRAFSLEEVDFNSIRDVRALIETAIEFERDSIMFYEILQSFAVDPEVLGHIRTVIDEEQRHITLLEEYQSTERRSGGETG